MSEPSPPQWLVWSLPLYLVAWTASYIAVMLLQGGPFTFTYFFDYLAWAWSFSGGELPMFIWFLSVVLFFGLLAGAIVITRIRNRRALNG